MQTKIYKDYTKFSDYYDQWEDRVGQGKAMPLSFDYSTRVFACIIKTHFLNH